MRRTTIALFASLAFAAAADLAAQQVDPATFDALRWRMIGPFRGGRTKAAAGIPAQPNVFYVAATNGGVWKTTDFGTTWKPIFDDQPTGSIGALAVAPSNPDIIYVGSGEGLQRPDLSTGDGIYRSADAGKTWAHLGLRDGQQIPQIVVDPRNPDRLFAAVLGHPYGPNPGRGLFRSTDGGRSFQKILYRDDNTGAVDVVLDPQNPDIVYAVLWESRQAPWENGVFTGPGSGLHKSLDGGNTWRQLTAGLPAFAEGLGRIGITIAPSDPSRMYASVEIRGAGIIYRSDDAGESWRRASDDGRVVGRPSDFAEVKVDPANPDIVYTGSVVAWKSTDGARTWTGFRGAPGGDDYHRIWINPLNPKIILLAADQGAVISVNGGESWSTWYNQPTAQFYHVSADNAFPYRVCGGQQESGSACVSSRGNDGQITFREWHPVGVEEYGYVAPDPLDPDIVYGGKVSRYDRRTGQVQNVAPRLFRDQNYRALRTAPVLFSPVDPRLLFFAANTIWTTRDGGTSWKQISGDLTRTDSVVPANVGKYAATPQATARHPGVVYTVAPSYRSANVIWAGSDDGLIHVTMNGGRTWKNVTPAGLAPWSKISLIEASHFDTLVAYAAVNSFRLDDLAPHIYRTRDGGRSWSHIAGGIPDGGIINAVREDPRKPGLLFAGSEREVYVSFDDGDHWQSLRLNMPAISIRDIVIKDDDLLAGTHGRGFWILDDITPLRQISPATASMPALLFQPARATRVRWNMNTDTPLPPDEPVAPNPPDGAILTYWLRDAALGAVTLEVHDRAGALVRKFSSDDPPERPIEGRNIPDYWIRPPQILPTAAGSHRFVWDLRYPDPKGVNFSYPIAAVYRNTAKDPAGPWVLPGTYTVTLTVAGARHSRPLSVRMDPRVKVSPLILAQQHALSLALTDAMASNADALQAVRALRARVRAAQTGASPTVQSALAAFDRQAAAVEGAGGGFGGQLAALYNTLQDADARPTSQLLLAIEDRRRGANAAWAAWRSLRDAQLAALNAQLAAAGAAPIP